MRGAGQLGGGPSPVRLLLGAALLVLAAACSHDLGPLRGEPNATYNGGDGGVDAARSVETETCAPCEPPPPVGELITPVACCTGSRGVECGVALAAGARCYTRDVPGVPDDTCPAVSRLGNSFAGCCRLDGQCGVVIDALKLGCVRRDEVPTVLGGPLAPRACSPKCDGDEACRQLSDLAVCVEDASHQADARYCAYSCMSDRDCVQLPNTVCAIQPNLTAQRFDAVCRKPIGGADSGAACDKANDCAHGVCLNAATNYCSNLCRTDLDCPGVGSQCKTSMIPLLDASGQTQSFDVCVVRR